MLKKIRSLELDRGVIKDEEVFTVNEKLDLSLFFTKASLYATEVWKTFLDAVSFTTEYPIVVFRMADVKESLFVLTPIVGGRQAGVIRMIIPAADERQDLQILPLSVLMDERNG